MPSDFTPVVLLMAIAGIIALVIPILSTQFGLRRPDPVKADTYECGVAELDAVYKRTSIRYYMTALTFIVFDVEIAFLYPWAVIVKKAVGAREFLFFAMLIFLVVILLAYAWEWKKGALEWD